MCLQTGCYHIKQNTYHSKLSSEYGNTQLFPSKMDAEDNFQKV